MSQERIFSVSEITRVIKELLEENIPTIWLQGEISNFKAHFSGHYYFTLKDETAQISAVMWKSKTFELDFQPEDGMLVQVLGRVRVYEKGGRYQIDALRMQPAGLGALQIAFERLKEKLLAEGLFDVFCCQGFGLVLGRGGCFKLYSIFRYFYACYFLGFPFSSIR